MKLSEQLNNLVLLQVAIFKGYHDSQNFLNQEKLGI